jgi:actin-related protein
MAGRRAHIDENKFGEFFTSLPDDAKGSGFWRIKRESVNAKGRGVIHSFVGFTQFQPEETYDSLRVRIKEEFAIHNGPGVYYLIPCNEHKAELKNTNMVKLSYKESEVPMADDEQRKLSDKTANPLDAIKRAHKDVAEVKALELQEKLMNKILGGKDKDDEEDDVKDVTGGMGNNMNDLLMYKMMFGENEKKGEGNGSSNEALKDLMEARMATNMAELKALMVAQQTNKGDDGKYDRLLEKLLDRPKDDDKFEKLLQQMMEKENSSKQENAFQSMMAMMVKQAQERDKERDAELKQREMDRKDEERRRDDERKEERRRYEDEARRREDDRKEERRREEELKKAEQQKFERELEEQRRRFDSELALRREEIKSESSKSKDYATEQQKLQLQFLSIFKDNKDSSLDMTSKIVDTLTGAGLSSMKTAQQAAESIMSIATQVDKHGGDKEKDSGGIGSILKDFAPLVGPLIGPYIEADAKSKLLQQAGQMAGGGGGLEQLAGMLKGGIPGMGGGRPPGPMPGAQRPPKRRAPQQDPVAAAARAAGVQIPPGVDVAQLARAAGLEGLQVTPEMLTQLAGAMKGSQPKGDSAGGPSSPAQAPKGDGGAFMITKFLQAYPVLKDALIGNIQDGLGVEMYLPILLGFDQPALEGLIANLPPTVVAAEVKKACSPPEAELVDKNQEWFKALRAAMIEELRNTDDDEDDEEEEGEEEEEAAPAEAKAPAPKAAPAPAPAAAPAPAPAPTPPAPPQAAQTVAPKAEASVSVSQPPPAAPQA